LTPDVGHWALDAGRRGPANRSAPRIAAVMRSGGAQNFFAFFVL